MLFFTSDHHFGYENSGDVNLATGLPPGCQWSGQAGTYGTLPNDEREGGPA